MGNPHYTPPPLNSDTTTVREGFWWRIDTFEKVLLFDSDPVGSVSFDVRSRVAKKPWSARISTGHAEQQRFASEAEAIAFVEAGMPAYLAFYGRLNPPGPAHSSPPLGL